MNERSSLKETAESTSSSMRVLPYDEYAEAAVLSAILNDYTTVAKSVIQIKEEYFYKNQHRVIFRAMRALFENQMSIDLITLQNHLESSGNLEKAGGKEYLSDIYDCVVSGAHFEFHTKIITDKYLLRELILTANKIVEKSYEGEFSTEDLIDYAENAIFKITESSKIQGFVKTGDRMTEVLEHIEEIMKKGGLGIGVTTGFHTLDRVIGSFRPGQLIVIAARPGMGKSAFALNIALNTALRQNTKVGIFTMEMSVEEVLLRMISTKSMVSMDNMLTGHGLDQHKRRGIIEQAEKISKLDIFLDDVGTNSPLDLRAKARRLKAEQDGLGLIIIDYMQLMASSRRNVENRQQEISEISRSMKILAKELQVPVIALSQLNRALENREDKRPRLSDLRESGAIEQDADLVMFIYREAKYKKTEENADRANIIIAKNRHGKTGEIEMRFVEDNTAFTDLEKQEHL
ncbi:MAG: replicative DNA helicase [Candidatus Cloacimonetes bacterium]|nr:replicative DNA helicase [Candidatus Cloacimonadota bacterium]